MSRYEDLSDEGEVDHAFFDSEVDEVAIKVQNNISETVKQKGHGSKLNGRKQKAVLKPQKSSSSDEESEENEKPKAQALFGRPSTETSSASSIAALRSKGAHSSGRHSSQSLKLCTTIPTGIPTIRREYEDSYYTDTEESSDEGKVPKYRPKPSKQPGSSRKNSVKKNIHIISSSSSSDVEDSYSDSCKSEPTHSHTKLSASASGSTLSSRAQSPKSMKKSLKGDKNSQVYHDESEDTVTDVTPLSTPDISPIQSFDLVANNDMKKKIVKRQENVSQELYDPETENKFNQKALHDAMDLNQLLKAFMDLDQNEQRNMDIDHPATARPKNYSFTNEEVRHIDRENQRLLKELSRQATKPRSKSITLKKAASPVPKLYHSTINRQREQLRIERDNMALLKRLESIKPTVGMKRSEQLMDYQRQVGYMNTSAASPRPAKASARRHSPSYGLSRASSAGSRRIERPLSTSSSAASLRPTKSNSARAAWM